MYTLIVLNNKMFVHRNLFAIRKHVPNYYFFFQISNPNFSDVSQKNQNSIELLAQITI